MSLKKSFFVITIVYLLAFAVAWAVFKLCGDLHVLWATLWADVAATLVVWLSGMCYKNSSMYDPYWSVAPPVVFTSWVLISNQGFTPVNCLFLIAVFFWGIRLTYNWAINWHGIKHQDWRYVQIREKDPKNWFIANLFGINMMPTLVVFLGMIPAYFAINAEGTSINIVTCIGFLICVAAPVIQFISDRQMRRFRLQNETRKTFINSGLWHYSRHPNYFGEVAFWWGIWIMQASVFSVPYASKMIYFTILGPVAMTLLFVFVSIPMMEKYIGGKYPGYKQYQKQVSMLFPWKKRTGKEL